MQIVRLKKASFHRVLQMLYIEQNTVAALRLAIALLRSAVWDVAILDRLVLAAYRLIKVRNDEGWNSPVSTTEELRTERAIAAFLSELLQQKHLDVMVLNSYLASVARCALQSRSDALTVRVLVWCSSRGLHWLV